MSAGFAVVAFVVIPWPGDVVVLPILAGWAVILAALGGSAGWRRPGRVLLLVGLAALGLGGVAIWLLAQIPD